MKHSAAILFLFLSTAGCTVYKDSPRVTYTNSTVYNQPATVPVNQEAPKVAAVEPTVRIPLSSDKPPKSEAKSTEYGVYYGPNDRLIDPKLQGRNWPIVPWDTPVSTSPPQPAAPRPPQTTTIEACGRVRPPVIGQIPRLTAKEIEVIAASKPSVANVQILAELEKIYKYASFKTQELQDAFEKQLKSCRKVKVLKD